MTTTSLPDNIRSLPPPLKSPIILPQWRRAADTIESCRMAAAPQKPVNEPSISR